MLMEMLQLAKPIQHTLVAKEKAAASIFTSRRSSACNARQFSSVSHAVLLAVSGLRERGSRVFGFPGTGGLAVKGGILNYGSTSLCCLCLFHEFRQSSVEGKFNFLTWAGGWQRGWQAPLGVTHSFTLYSHPCRATMITKSLMRLKRQQRVNPIVFFPNEIECF